MREAHLRDAVALCSLLSFLEKEVRCGLHPPPPPLHPPPSPTHPPPSSGGPEWLTVRNKQQGSVASCRVLFELFERHLSGVL